MAYSPTDICNIALTDLDVDPIVSIDDPNLTAARKCKRIFQVTQDTVLRDNDWTFNRVKKALTPFTIPDAYLNYRYEYGYVYPSDCLKLWRIYPPEGCYNRQDYEIQRDLDSSTLFVMCNVDNAVGRYSKVVESTEWMDAEFVEAFALKLASRLAYSILKNQKLKNQLSQEYMYALSNAETSDREQYKTEPEEPQSNYAVAALGGVQLRGQSYGR